MTEPVRVEYDIGRDRYGRPSRLIGERTGGQLYWSIVSDAINQRDEGERIAGLTSEQLLAITRLMPAVKP